MLLLVMILGLIHVRHGCVVVTASRVLGAIQLLIHFLLLIWGASTSVIIAISHACVAATQPIIIANVVLRCIAPRYISLQTFIKSSHKIVLLLFNVLLVGVTWKVCIFALLFQILFIVNRMEGLFLLKFIEASAIIVRG